MLTHKPLGVAGLTPFSSVDYPGALAAVVFIAGCPWRCGYCHNPQLQRRRAARLDWQSTLTWLQRRRGLLDAVVFSGGEPTLDPALAQAIIQVQGMGFKVGLHTAGMSPKHLSALLPWLDWVGLDIKAAAADATLHRRIIGIGIGSKNAAAAVQRSLAILLAAGIPLECRSTIHPQLHDGAALRAMAEQLRAAGVRDWVLQIARPEGCERPLPPVAADYPAPALLAELTACLPGLSLRRA